jgi:hypothetical protein
MRGIQKLTMAGINYKLSTLHFSENENCYDWKVDKVINFLKVPSYKL